MEAHLWQHKNGTFYALFTTGGATSRKSLKTKDRREAARRLKNLNRDVSAGKVVPITSEAHRLRMSLKPFIREFLEHKEAEVTPATWKQYHVSLGKAVECWGDIPMTHITARHLDQFKTHLIKTGVQKSTANKDYRYLKAALIQASEWEYCSKIKFPKTFTTPSPAPRFLSVEELRGLIDAIQNPEFADFCLFAAYTGLRISEIIRMTTADVDNPHGFLRVGVEQKNHTESRIPINDHARAILDKYKDRGIIFRCGGRGNISKQFRAALKVAGLPVSDRKKGIVGIRFHDLRHTFASHLAMDNTDIRTVQMLMRQKSISSTLIYAQLSPNHLTQASNSLNYGPMPVPQNNKKQPHGKGK